MGQHGFDTVIGHADILRAMRSMIAGGRVGHAYIFDGAKGMGKKTLSKAFAKTLQCESGGDAPCDSCLSCRVFDSGNHPDIFYVKAAKTKHIGVDDVRDQIVMPMSQKPFRYRYKIFIVDDADTLTPAAQNALLKTIEEPAPFGIFMLLAARTYHFLPTVLSRCVTFKLRPLSDAQVAKALTVHGVSEAKATVCAVFARGNIGAALDTARSEEFFEMRQQALYIACHIYGSDLIQVFDIYHRLEKWKDSIGPLLDMLYLCYRDMLMLKQTPGDVSRLIQQNDSEALVTAAEAQSMASLCNGIQAVAQARRTLQRNGNLQLTLELMLIAMSGK